MRPQRVRPAAALLLLTLLTASGAASCAGSAHGQGDVSVTPYHARRGDRVEVRTGVCHGDAATARSDAFEATVHLRPGHGGELRGHGKIGWEAKPGPHAVWVHCAGENRRLRGQVVVSDEWNGGWHHQPSAPVAAGGGGTARAAGNIAVGTYGTDGADGGLPGPGALPAGLLAAGTLTLTGVAVRRRLRARAEGRDG